MSQAHSVLMDKVYRHQRFIYDASRKYFLLGRDHLLTQLYVHETGSVLEVGCGTGRNLRVLGSARTGVSLYGLDASKEMLATATKNNSRLIDQGRLSLCHGLAEDFSLRDFGRSEPFDAIFFSYSLSMIPDWKAALTNACARVRPGGVVALVDFYHQKRFPGWFRRALTLFLSLYHVRFDPLLVKHLEEQGAYIESLHYSYSFYAVLRPSHKKVAVLTGHDGE